MIKPKLHLIPNSISDCDRDNVIPANVQNIILQLDTFIVENLRTSRRFLRSIGYNKNFDEVTFFLLNKHTKAADLSGFLEPIKNKDIGLLSEAGLPCIADPGADIVSLAQQRNIDVVPYVGPSSIMLALMASGFNGQNFAFIGYLPIDQHQRNKVIKKIEQNAIRENQTQIFIEAPYRNNKLLDALKTNLNDKTKLCVAAKITASDEYIKTKSIADWKKTKIDINKKETIFLIYKL